MFSMSLTPLVKSGEKHILTGLQRQESMFYFKDAIFRSIRFTDLKLVFSKFQLEFFPELRILTHTNQLKFLITLIPTRLLGEV